MLLKVQPNPEVIEHVSIFSTLLIFLAVSQHLLTCARQLFAPKKGKKREMERLGGCRSFSLPAQCVEHRASLGTVGLLKRSKLQCSCTSQTKSDDSFISFCNLAPTVNISGSQPCLVESNTSTKPHQAFESSKNCVLNSLANQKVQLCCLTKNKHQKTPMELNFGRLSWASVWFWQPVEDSLPNPTKEKI